MKDDEGLQLWQIEVHLCVHAQGCAYEQEGERRIDRHYVRALHVCTYLLKCFYELRSSVLGELVRKRKDTSM